MECRTLMSTGSTLSTLPTGLFDLIIEYLSARPEEIFSLRVLSKQFKGRVHSFWKNKYNRMLMEISLLHDIQSSLREREDVELFNEVDTGLNQAEDNLVTVTRKDITELKSYVQPFADVTLAVGLVGLVLGVVKTDDQLDWHFLRFNVLSASPGIKIRIKRFDRNNIPAENIKKAEKFIALNQAHMGYQHIAITSPAAANMFRWAQRMIEYHNLRTKAVELPLFTINERIKRLIMTTKPIKKLGDIFSIAFV
mmetsp:Transcript_80/g.72  ORF Transcript_80/g.72 Transcript_80/m.72 type:complete len:252 (-) Transcript_80:1509-2264(-)